MPHWFYIVFLFAVGSSIGSFLNVVVYRLPRGQSLVHPPSRCPKCEHRLAWYDNLPVVGWIFLGGKCRYCRQPISARYPIVEGVVGLLFAAFYVLIFMAHQGPFWAEFDEGGQLTVLWRMSDLAVDWPIFGLYLAAASALLAASLIDAELYLIPAVLPLIVAGLGVLVHTFADRPGLPGTLSAGPREMALSAGGVIGMIASIAMLRLGFLKRSFEDGGSPLEVDKRRQKEGETLGPEYTAGQVRREIFKELIFLLPPLALGGLAMGLASDGEPMHSFWVTAAHMDSASGFLGSLLGGLIGGFAVWVTRILGSLAFGKEAMGLGDVDLMFAVGTVVGGGAATAAFLIAPFFALPLGLAMWVFKSRRQLPYGPYLSMATVLVMLFYFPIYDYLRPGVIGLGELLRLI